MHELLALRSAAEVPLLAVPSASDEPGPPTVAAIEEGAAPADDGASCRRMAVATAVVGTRRVLTSVSAAEAGEGVDKAPAGIDVTSGRVLIHTAGRKALAVVEKSGFFQEARASSPSAHGLPPLAAPLSRPSPPRLPRLLLPAPLPQLAQLAAPDVEAGLASGAVAGGVVSQRLSSFRAKLEARQVAERKSVAGGMAGRVRLPPFSPRDHGSPASLSLASQAVSMPVLVPSPRALPPLELTRPPVGTYSQALARLNGEWISKRDPSACAARRIRGGRLARKPSSAVGRAKGGARSRWRAGNVAPLAVHGTWRDVVSVVDNGEALKGVLSPDGMKLEWNNGDTWQRSARIDGALPPRSYSPGPSSNGRPTLASHSTAGVVGNCSASMRRQHARMVAVASSMLQADLSVASGVDKMEDKALCPLMSRTSSPEVDFRIARSQSRGSGTSKSRGLAPSPVPDGQPQAKETTVKKTKPTISLVAMCMSRRKGSASKLINIAGDLAEGFDVDGISMVSSPDS